MTELETLERARDYMEKLANGIDPITGAEVPEDSVLNNVRLSRCFFYVESVLRRTIENGGMESRRKRTGRDLFFLTAAQKESFPYFEEPVGITDFVNRLNEQVNPERVKKLSTTAVTGYLLETGFLQEQLREDGKKYRCPTEAGRSIGIITQLRRGQYGEYEAVLYGIDAQHFIIDNLDAILLAQQERKEKNKKRMSAAY